MAFEDQNLECKECSKNFVWSASEQAFFEKKGFKNVPARCPECRVKAREKRVETQAAYQVKCADCGKTGDAPFEPTGQPVYCEECFKKIQSQHQNAPQETKESSE